MSETPPEPSTRYPWLPLRDVGTPEDDTYTAGVLTWLQIESGVASPLAGVAEQCRRSAARYCEGERPDLFAVDSLDPIDDDVVMAGLIAAARLYARRTSPAGLASYGEFGASQVLRLDPDVARLLGTGRHAAPAVG